MTTTIAATDERTPEAEADTQGYILPLIYVAAFSTGFALGFGFGPLPDVPGVTVDASRYPVPQKGNQA